MSKLEPRRPEIAARLAALGYKFHGPTYGFKRGQVHLYQKRVRTAAGEDDFFFNILEWRPLPGIEELGHGWEMEVQAQGVWDGVACNLVAFTLRDDDLFTALPRLEAAFLRAVDALREEPPADEKGDASR